MSQPPEGPGTPPDPQQPPHQGQPNPGQGQYQGQPHAHPQQAPLSPGEEQGWGVATHLGGVFVSWLVPLVVWLIFRERSPMIDDHGKEALNWQITLFIGYVIGYATMIILIGFIIVPLIFVIALIFGILGAVAAYNRRPFRYPFNIRFIK